MLSLCPNTSPADTSPVRTSPVLLPPEPRGDDPWAAMRLSCITVSMARVLMGFSSVRLNVPIARTVTSQIKGPKLKGVVQ